jgi:ATP-binding cassette subfamily B protein
MPAQPIEDVYRADHPWRTLLAVYRPEWKSLAIGEVAYLFKASPLWVMPVVTANLIDIMSGHSRGGVAAIWLNAAIGAVFIVQNVPSAMVFAKYTSRAIRNVENRLRSALVRRLQMLSIAYHDKTSTGTLQTKVLRDVESIEQLSRQLTDAAVVSIVSIMVALGVTAWRMPAFLPVFLLLVPLVAWLRRFVTRRLASRNQEFRRALESMTAQIGGMISMIPVARAHAAEGAEIARAEDQFGRVREAGQSFDRQAALFGAIAWVTFMLLNLGALVAAALLSYRGVLALKPGDIVLLATYFQTVIQSVMQLNSMIPILTRGFDALRSIGEVIECPDIEENRGRPAVGIVRGGFRFEHVDFDFSAVGHSHAALRGIDLEIAPGETLGIVGASGSGKSTLMSLVIGFHRPTHGRILLDGMDMNGIDLRTYRKHLAVVGQQTILFEGTLRENILYGLSDVTEARLEAAIEAANALEFIRELPRGLNTELGEQGARLSGGQRQRVAIARALLRDPKILILDEATSALDTASEAAVQQGLERLMAGRTTFVVAHRLNTLRNATRFIELSAGRIVREGIPAELGELRSFKN